MGAQSTSGAVKFLNDLYDFALTGRNRDPQDGRKVEHIEFSEHYFASIFCDSGLARTDKGPQYSVADARLPEVQADIRETSTMVDLLRRHGILEQHFEMPIKNDQGGHTYTLKITYSLSSLGPRFMEACRPPKRAMGADRGYPSPRTPQKRRPPLFQFEFGCLHGILTK